MTRLAPVRPEAARIAAGRSRRRSASYSFNREAFSGGSTKAIEARTVETLSRLPSSRFLDDRGFTAGLILVLAVEFGATSAVAASGARASTFWKGNVRIPLQGSPSAPQFAAFARALHRPWRHLIAAASDETREISAGCGSVLSPDLWIHVATMATLDVRSRSVKRSLAD